MPFDEHEQIEFDEAWYLAANSDVVLKQDGGHWRTGLDHYLAHGRAEGRKTRADKNYDLDGVYDQHNRANYLSPTELAVSQVIPKGVAIVGSCLMGGLHGELRRITDCPVDMFLVNGSAAPPERTADELSGYDLQIIQIPLRGAISDDALAKLPHVSPEACETALSEATGRLEFFLRSRMSWNEQHGLLTLVTNFFVPQRNPNGLLFPRYDLANPEYFIERLNQNLEQIVRGYKNAHILDLDRISASIGRRYVQDDSTGHFSHGSMIPTPGELTNRMEPVGRMSQYYDLAPRHLFAETVWREIVSIFRVIRQTDAVKLIVVDLDDTLWNGVTGDMADIQPVIREGWPLGFAEALLFLKKRGVLLAIVSKNEESRIRKIWPKIYGNIITLDDFAAIRINWRSKIENMAEILEGMSLLPRSVVFVDDNPVERASMKAAFPDMRILGRHPYYLRRALMWGTETQVVSITEESGKRTEMIQAQMERETSRQSMGRDDFLKAAAPRVTMLAIQSTEHPRFARCLELVNKTNQFNTTGKRWTMEEVSTFFADGGAVYAFEVSDSLAGDYGLVGVVFTKGRVIEQWAMSCRVLGMEVENAVMAVVVKSLRDQFAGNVIGKLVETDANFPCRDLFAKCGLRETDGHWVIAGDQPLAAPAHVTVG